MNKFRQILTGGFLLLFSLAPGSAHASLPVAVDGETLPSLAPMLERVLPAVVNIYTESRVTEQRQSPFRNDPFFEKFFGGPQGQPRERRVSSLGSGVIIDADKGHVITNSHVIAGADQISVRLNDGRDLEATLVGQDADADIAVIQIPAEALQHVEIGDSDKLRVLVGINTAILAPGGGNIGIGFAIPINMAQLLTRQIIEYGEVRRGRLGVIAQNLSPELAEALGISSTKGAVISQVMPDTAAEAAGLKEGDVIIAVDDREISDASGLRNTIGLYRADDEVSIRFIRDEKESTLRIRLKPIDPPQGQGLKLSARLEGVRLEDIDDQDGTQGERGVRVAQVEQGSPAFQAGLREGDLIISVNKQPVYGLKDVEQSISERDSMLLLNILRGNSGLFIVIR
ncbi:MAG: PDZ domain-containing protein [Gammaproteobacteria bacterium]|nr:PDZ domain-containing protein [Gammaproteobacteria bacterium]